MNTITFEAFTAGKTEGIAFSRLLEMCCIGMTPNVDPLTQSYGIVMQRRILGKYTDRCTDNYYIAYTAEKCLSRLWTGWGKHKDAVGNFGHFLTLPECRGMGLGREVLKLWSKDMKERPDAPLALFCTAEPEIAEIYRPYGFREISSDRNGGPLYMPLGDSPATFAEFCDQYYQPSATLIHQKATIEYRHEVDCLLRFAFALNRLDFAMGDRYYVEDYLVACPERVGIFLSEDGHCVGWSLDGNPRIYPLYKQSKIIETQSI